MNTTKISTKLLFLLLLAAGFFLPLMWMLCLGIGVYALTFRLKLHQNPKVLFMAAGAFGVLSGLGAWCIIRNMVGEKGGGELGYGFWLLVVYGTILGFICFVGLLIAYFFPKLGFRQPELNRLESAANLE